MGTRYRGTGREVRALNAFIKLMRAAESVSGRVEAPLAQLGLSVSQFGVLDALMHIGPMHQKDLSGKILKSRGNITMVINNLEKRGLVKRVRDAEDRRHYLVKITEKGLRLIGPYFPGHVARIAEEMGVLTPDEQEELGRLCKKLGLKKER